MRSRSRAFVSLVPWLKAIGAAEVSGLARETSLGQWQRVGDTKLAVARNWNRKHRRMAANSGQQAEPSLPTATNAATFQPPWQMPALIPSPTSASEGRVSGAAGR